MSETAKITRVTVDAAGYRWRVYGAFARGHWRCDLVELLGFQLLDIPVDRRLRAKLREALARCFVLPLAAVRPIPLDSILAETI